MRPKRDLVQELGGRWLERGAGRDDGDEFARMVGLHARRAGRAAAGAGDRPSGRRPHRPHVRERLPLFAGAVEAVTVLAAIWPVALASSANREIIDLVTEVTGLDAAFTATVSSEGSSGASRRPDVYIEAARRPRA